MPYLEKVESEKRIAQVKSLLQARRLDIALVDYDEFNIGNWRCARLSLSAASEHKKRVSWR